MLIEVRSSPDDTNNTANQLFQRFNETLILKPRSKIALVSALITTTAAGGFRVDGTNQTMTLKVGSIPQVSFNVPIGTYTLTALCLAIQTAIRDTFFGLRVILKDLFYPDTSIVVTKSASNIVSISFAFNPQGFNGGNPTLVGGSNVQVTATNLDLNSVATGVLMRSREEIITNLATAQEVASGFDALNPLLPYAKGTGTGDHTGVFQVDKLLGVTPRQQHIGLNQSVGLPTGRWLLPSANPYQRLGFSYRFDNYTPVGGVNHGYDWIVSTPADGVYYLKATTDLDFGVNTTHKAIDPLAYDQTWSVREVPNGHLGVAIWDGSELLTPLNTPAGDEVLINRAGQNNYDLEVNTNSRVQVRYNGALLNTPADTLLADGDGLRWVVNALDNSTIKTKHPIPQIYHAREADPKWVEIPLNEGKVLPDVSVDDELIPSFHADGLVACGTIGTGDNTDTNATTSFLASDMSVSNLVGTFFAGEVLYQLGATTPAGGTNMKLLAVAAAPHLSIGNRGTLASVLVMGNGYDGRGYANGMTFDVKGLKSGSTATITINAVASPIATITDGGTTYTQDNEYNFVLNAGGSPTQPPVPFSQSGRSTRGGKVKATAVAGGVISAVEFVDGGNGFCIGDTIEIQGNGGGDGAGDARITIQQVCEDVTQLVMTPTGCMDTYRILGAFPPMLPQNEINLDTKDIGLMLDLTPVEFDGSVGTGVSQPIIKSSIAPTPNNPANENILVDLPSMPINSRNSGRQGNQTGGNTDNHIATIPYQTDLNNVDEAHKQHYEPFNMIYHSLDNEADLNLNSFSVRLTNFDGTLRTDLSHPTQLTFSIQPDYL